MRKRIIFIARKNGLSGRSSSLLSVSIFLLITLKMTCYPVCVSDDTRTLPAELDDTRTLPADKELKDYKCELRGPGQQPVFIDVCIRVGINGSQACMGNCYVVEPVERLYVCVPSTGSTCTGEPKGVKVRVHAVSSCEARRDSPTRLECICRTWVHLDPPLVAEVGLRVCRGG